ncbi:sn-glycerol-3-phosphate ABC transporter ATP-binding protein UgpC [Pelagicoccus sp. SDUM812002]|uniref:ABC transporter ATP-binding protein n=1 Tax=Pelagicoccus sp. SDUM812002 TaxID=3041266 RepID=UPI0028107B7C|nr:sn-glycerol-3-phosphate ABC transporter ATP-binding protein UgpC [Pelagicoccus sp. SDUM812002]MDQ8186736.1 sn-glycerol-3-phosphate ABC transporter ATP-binding protein UgpC [Pelagicoccus sp. SDUM812002]
MATVELKNLLKIYPNRKGEDVKAVNHIDLSIRDREFMVLVGPSGCGKSTSLRMIAGLEDITDGEILIDGKIINDVQPKDRDIAMVFQNYALYPHMSVYENMAFGLKLRKYKKDEIDRRVKDAAEILGIEELLQRKPAALSGGQRQRVAVGRAIVRKPKVFLFDEPLSNLDAKMRVSTRAEISKLHARLASTMIYVTHDQVEAMTMGDRICVMNGGDIMQVDEPLQIYNHPANTFVASFIGSPPMNLMLGSIQRQSQALYFKADGAEILLKLSNRLADAAADYVGRSIIFGVRPENIQETNTLKDFEPEHTAHVTIDVAEPMGNETILYLSSGDQSLIGRVRSDVRTEVNKTITVWFDPDRAHLFDPETEENLSLAT